MSNQFVFQGKAISIIQPWASVIVFCGKTFENRTWKTNYRGPIAIHASSKTRTEDLGLKVKHTKSKSKAAVLDLIKKNQRQFEIAHDTPEIINSHIIAIGMLTDCLEESDSVWHTPEYWGFKLEYVIPIKPVPMKGKLGVWDCSFSYANTFV